MELTKEIVDRLVTYFPETGEMLWKVRDVGLFVDSGKLRYSREDNAARWNGKHAGRPALTNIDSTGYRSGFFFKKPVRLHRVAFLLMEGRWPAIIDHKNGKRLDNRWENLREVNQSRNMRNSRIRSDNTSGFGGVNWDKSRNLWHVRIKTDDGYKFIGRFKNFEEAVESRKQANMDHEYTNEHGMERKTC